MALTGWSANTNYLQRTEGIGTVPMLFSIWCYSATGTTAFRPALTTCINGDVDFNQQCIRADSNDTLRALTTGTASQDQANTAGTHANNTWFHLAGMFLAANSRKCYYNSTASTATNATSLTPNAPDRTRIGIDKSTGFAWSNAGGLAETSIWDLTGFSVANSDSLVALLYGAGGSPGNAGGNPLNITAQAAQPWTGKLIAYWPLTSTSDLADATGNGHLMSMIGTLTNHASHPTIDAPTGGVAVNTPGLLLRLRRRRTG